MTHITPDVNNFTRHRSGQLVVGGRAEEEEEEAEEDRAGAALTTKKPTHEPREEMA